MLVKDLMVQPVIFVFHNSTVGEALELLKKHDIRHLPVVDSNQTLQGITSETDLLRIFPKCKEKNSFEYNLIARTPVSQLMKNNPFFVEPHITVEEAALIMKSHKIGCLPVVENQKVTGMISRTDVIEAFINSMGLGKTGVRITIAYKKRLGFLSDLIILADKFSALIDHVVTFDTEIVLKVQPTKADIFIRELGLAGFVVSDVTCIEHSVANPCSESETPLPPSLI